MKLTCQYRNYDLRVCQEEDYSDAEFQVIKHSFTVISRFEEDHTCKKSIIVVKWF